MNDPSLYRYPYCLFCKASSEHCVAGAIATMFPQSKAKILYQDKWKVVKGVRSLEHRKMLPGYVFVCSPSELSVERIDLLSDVLRVLGQENEGYLLDGDDLKFSRWVFECKGFVGASMGHSEGKGFVVTSGPLKALTNNIEKVDKHTQTAKVNIFFYARVMSLWLPFEWDDGAENRQVI
ncbi:MAG: hypothetical protein GX796_10210 [Clostridiaceae bacterium]|nr:hypothetical protein [Clostridiaceae bacterium]